MYICVLFLPVSFFKNITSYTINSVLSLTAVWILSAIVFVKLIYMCVLAPLHATVLQAHAAARSFATHQESLPAGITRAIGPSPLSARTHLSHTAE